MKFLVGNDWKKFFDVIIVQARKPRFFTEESRPLKIYDEINHTQLWDRVTKLSKGTIYSEGTVKQLQELTGWRGHQVLYFGDHPYSDLADVTLEHGWRTGAIIKELAVSNAALRSYKCCTLQQYCIIYFLTRYKIDKCWVIWLKWTLKKNYLIRSQS